MSNGVTGEDGAEHVGSMHPVDNERAMSKLMSDVEEPAEGVNDARDVGKWGDITKEQVNARFRPFVRISPPWNTYERVRTFLLSILIFPFRLLFFFAVLSLLWLLSRLALLGVEIEKRPEEGALGTVQFARWRRSLMSLARPLVRAALFVSFGIFWIEHRKASSSSQLQNGVPLIVANHLGYLDIVVLLALYGGSFVAKEDIAKTRFVGSIAMALQCLFVSDSGGLTEHLKQRCRATHQCQTESEEHHLRFCRCPRTLIVFPEGTTTNGTGLITFRRGAFCAGVPILPVAIRFPHRRFNLSWETIRFREHLWRSMTQIYNRVEVLEMDVHVPSAEEIEDPSLFARNMQIVFEDKLQLKTYKLNRKHKFAYHSYVLGKLTADALFQKADELALGDPLLQETP